MYRPNQTNVQTPLTSTKASHKQNLNKVGHKVRCGVVVVVGGMVTLIMPVPIMLLIIPLLKTNAIQPRYNLEEDVV